MDIIKNKYSFRLYALLVHFFVFGQLAYATHLHLDSGDDEPMHFCVACLQVSDEHNDLDDIQSDKDDFVLANHIAFEVQEFTIRSKALYRESEPTTLNPCAQHPRGPPRIH